MQRAVLNVGGGTKAIAIPAHYNGWRHDLLDIDPLCNPDVLADARDLGNLQPAVYDAIYCSHNLEHYFLHDAARVVSGFNHVLKPDGFAEILVPDILAMMRHVVEKNLDFDDVLYQSPSGPICARDMLYGYQLQIRQSGVDFYAHKNAFSIKTLTLLMAANGFPVSGCATSEPFQINGIFFKQMPSEEIKTLLEIGEG